jgi:putative mRNA 3-end processing factor
MIYSEICCWVRQNQAEGNSSVFQAYSLGKAQRIIDALRAFEGKIFVHNAIWLIQQALSADGWDFPVTNRMTVDIPIDIRKGSVYITPSSIEQTPVAALIGPYRSAACSGWMQSGGNRRRGNADKGFVLSDHADWNGLLSAVKETGAEKVFVTHGFQSVFSRYLNEIGIAAAEVKTHFGGEEETVILNNISTDPAIDSEG